ncbi:MAG TPA: hypothetical protein VFI47_16630 [Acidimicrobiales bacterium]|nr:hypothetical protein [Acidimicrobiales bacterium]
MSGPGLSPREDPLGYPGRAPRTSGLMTEGPFLAAEPRRGRRLAQARVVLGSERPAALEVGLSRVSLGFALLALNAVPIEARIPVLAVGSNAAIAQMQSKFRAAGISCVMPFTWADVTGIRVGVAAMVSRWGYVPAAPVFEPAATSRLAVNWLDPEQIEALDETEVGYERRLLVEGDGTRVRLESGEELTSAGIYVCREGVLAEPGTGRAMGLPAQRDLIAGLLARGGRAVRAIAGRDVEGFLRAATERDRRDLLQKALFASPDVPVLPWTAPGRSGEPEAYGSGRSGLPSPPDAAGALRVAPSPDGIERRGEQVVLVPSERWEAMGRPSHVVVRSCMDPLAPPAVGRVLDGEPGDEVQVDQSLRNGLGVEIGEYVTLEATGVDRHHVADLVLGTPHSLLCRVQQAELVTSERPAALLPSLALDLLGVESGDRVVIEGLPADPGGPLEAVTVRAFLAPDDTLNRRERLAGGGFQHRFPSARDALGVYPDLPWIFIDRALRGRLALTQPRLAVVRVRASRKDQATKELREMLLVVVIAFIGLLQVVDVGWAWVVFLVLATAVVATVVGMRLRSRLRAI